MRSFSELRLLLKDKHLIALIIGFKRIMGLDESERLKTSQNLLYSVERGLAIQQVNTKTIQKIVKDNPNFVDDLDIDSKKLQDYLKRNKKNFEDFVIGKRASSRKITKMYQFAIFHRLKKLGYSNSEQIGFVFHLYKSIDYDNMRSNINNAYNEALRERLRKDQKEAMITGHPLKTGN